MYFCLYIKKKKSVHQKWTLRKIGLIIQKKLSTWIVIFNFLIFFSFFFSTKDFNLLDFICWFWPFLATNDCHRSNKSHPWAQNCPCLEPLCRKELRADHPHGLPGDGRGLAVQAAAPRQLGHLHLPEQHRHLGGAGGAGGCLCLAQADWLDGVVAGRATPV